MINEAAATALLNVTEDQKKEDDDIWSVSINLLVVDDCKISRRYLKKMLTANGHSVTEAFNGEECLQRLDEAEGPRIILMDHNMPVLTGNYIIMMMIIVIIIIIIIIIIKDQRQLP
jgi:PleD family two-component response regulator